LNRSGVFGAEAQSRAFMADQVITRAFALALAHPKCAARGVAEVLPLLDKARVGGRFAAGMGLSTGVQSVLSAMSAGGTVKLMAMPVMMLFSLYAFTGDVTYAVENGIHDTESLVESFLQGTRE
jgi:hypothetical protein